MKYTTYDAFNRITSLEVSRIVSFLYTHLDEYGDTKSAIQKALEYAAKDRAGMGGHILVCEDQDEIVGAVVINKTGMEEYIPENILVYIATHKEHRGKGIGKELMERAIKVTTGDIALHVEHNNPAKFLYEKLGFKNPYLEMRLKKA